MAALVSMQELLTLSAVGFEDCYANKHKILNYFLTLIFGLPVGMVATKLMI